MMTVPRSSLHCYSDDEVRLAYVEILHAHVETIGKEESPGKICPCQDAGGDCGIDTQDTNRYPRYHPRVCPSKEEAPVKHIFLLSQKVARNSSDHLAMSGSSEYVFSNEI